MTDARLNVILRTSHTMTFLLGSLLWVHSAMAVNPSDQPVTSSAAEGIDLGAEPQTDVPVQMDSEQEPDFSAASGSQASAPAAPPRQSMTLDARAETLPDADRSLLETKVTDEAKRRLNVDLQRYCLDYCSILSMQVQADEAFDSAQADIGFESKTNTSSGRKFQIKNIATQIIIDDRFGTQNSQRLEALFTRLGERYPHPISFQWSYVTFPDNGTNTRSESQVRLDFSNQIRSQLEKLRSDYCPRDCEIHSVEAQVTRANVDEARDSGSASRYLFVRDSKGALYVRGVEAKISLNSMMESSRKNRIEKLMREHLTPFGTVTLKVSEIPFPQSAEEVQKDLDETRRDPFGLEKLSRLMQLFKEHANTKEIIKESSNNQQSEKSATEKSSSKENSEKFSREMRDSETKHYDEKNSITSSEKNDSSSANSDGFWNRENLLILGGILFALLCAGAIGLRFIVTGKRMQAIVHEGLQGQPMHDNASQQGYAHQPRATASFQGSHLASGNEQDVRKRMHRYEVRDEIIGIFVGQPRVAREVLSRILREDGIENCAKYVPIFGEMMIFELLGDDDLKADLVTLAEFVHINAPVVSEDEQIELLRSLKLKLTAGKMRQMTQKTLDVFDFLKSKSPQQIFQLIRDESSKSQGIVLTQLSTQKRRSIFELYEGSSKIDLLKELSSSDVAPRDYLHNVAQALKRKATNNPNFDGENVRGTDVLLDLLDRADLSAQRELMTDLDQTNPDSAWLLRSRLVTIETLAFLKDGVLVEIFLGLESDAISTFLSGTREHIRRLIMAKAPVELTASWEEELQRGHSVDFESYKLAEMQVVAKVRACVTAGMINLTDINSLIYPVEPNGGSHVSEGNYQKAEFKIDKPLVA